MSEAPVEARANIVFRGLEELRFLSNEELDLGRIALAVAAEDRRRRRPPSWRRQLRVEVRVALPRFWAGERRQRIENTLSWLTGDDWSLSFLRLRDPPEQTQASLWPPGDGPVVCFSGGVDSLAAALGVLRVRRGARLLSADTSSHGTALARAVAEPLTNAFQVHVPIQLRARARAEPSYRTRTFCFFLLASIAASAAGASSVIVGENGQGIIGPSVLPSLNEYPHYGAHPVLGRRVRDIVNNALGVDIPIEFPHIWQTKNEVVQQIASHQALLLQTSSCPLEPARQGRPGAPRMCGACAGCLLRRMAFRASGFDDSAATAFWHDLDAASLAQSCNKRFSTRAKETEAATAAVLMLDQLGRPAARRSIDHIAFALASPMGFDVTETRKNIVDLLCRHEAEWHAFLDGLHPRSWLRQTIEERRVRR